MQRSTTNWYFSSNHRVPVYRETRFRTPTGAERKMALWVDRIGAGTTVREAGARRRLRILGQYAVVAVDSGSGRLISERSGAHVVRSGDVIFVAPGDPSAYFPETGWYTRWIVWNGPEAGTLRELRYVPPTSRTISHAARAVHQAWLDLVRTMDREEAGAVLERKLTVLRMVRQLHCSMECLRTNRTPDAAVNEAIAYLSEHYARPMSVPELAGMFHLSETHFRRCFKERTGRSPKQFVMALRISHAKELLMQGLPPKVVGARVGFREVAYFGRVFKKLTGMSPGRFAAFRH